MVSSVFNNLFMSYIFINYFIQPIFMVLVVIFLVKVSKNVAHMAKCNKVLLEKLEKLEDREKQNSSNETELDIEN